MSSLAESSPSHANSWSLAVRLLERWREEDERLDHLLEQLPADLPSGVRARVQALLLGALRHLGRIDRHLDALMQRPPRPSVWAGLVMAGCELIEGDGSAAQVARVGHHLVEQVKRMATKQEAGFANAVVRRLAQRLQEESAPDHASPLVDWAAYHSHPDWLVERWAEQFGVAAARSFLQWNQTAGHVFVRRRGAATSDPAGDAPLEAELIAVPHADGFFQIRTGAWGTVEPAIKAGRYQVQDPATRHAIELLNPQSGEDVLDLCAAPGGKSLALADRMGQGRVVALDLSGPRMQRLRENFQRAPAGVRMEVVGADVLRGARRGLAARNLPTEYPAVLVDVPCSNTGVMRHRVDVRWRLEPNGFKRHAVEQLAFLQAAAERVAPGGRLVYSTCSIDPEENEQVVRAFVRRSRGQFELADSHVSLPWESGEDGAGAFLLRRS